MSAKLRTETFFIDPVEGLNEGVLKSVDLVVTQLPVAVGNYPPEKYNAVSGKKYGALWSDNPWSDILDDDPLGHIHDIQRFLDKYYFLDIAVIGLRGESSYNSDGSLKKDVYGNQVYDTKLVKIYEASKHVDNTPTVFAFKVFEDDGTTPITDAVATVRLGNKEVVIEYDEDVDLYTGEVYGIGKASLTIEADGFDPSVIPLNLSVSGFFQIVTETGYEKDPTYLSIIMVAEEE